MRPVSPLIGPIHSGLPFRFFVNYHLHSAEIPDHHLGDCFSIEYHMSLLCSNHAVCTYSLPQNSCTIAMLSRLLVILLGAPLPIREFNVQSRMSTCFEVAVVQSPCTVVT